MFRPFSDEHTGRDRFRSLPDGAEPTDVVAKLQSNGDVEFGEVNIRDMDPEEIRVRRRRRCSARRSNEPVILLFSTGGTETVVHIVARIEDKNHA